MKKRLISVIKPRDDENVFGYINRLTVENGYESNIWILNDSNLTRYYGPRNLLPMKFDFSSLINLTGLSLSEILTTTFYYNFGYEEEEFEHFNYLVYQESLMGTHAKVCPKCLEYFGSNNKLWDLRILLACPIHKCFLVSKCNSCGKQIRQYRKDFFYCNCKKDLRELRILHVNESDSLLSNLIYYKYYGNERYLKEASRNRLIQVDLKYIILIYTFFLKLHYRDKSRAGSVAIPFDPEDNEFSEVIVKVTKIFEDWPINYYNFLHEYKNVHKSKPKYDRGSYINNYGYFHIDLYNKYNHHQMNFLREEYENYIYENWDNSLISNNRSFKKRM